MRYARLIRPRLQPALDPAVDYMVVRDSEVQGYIWIEGQGIGDPFLNPNQRCVYGPHFEIREDPPASS
jgi:hypothetical protein